MRANGTAATGARSVEARVRSMADRFRADAAGSLCATVELALGETRFTVRIDGGSCTVEPGAAEAPDARITTDAETWLSLDSGAESGIDAFLDGKLHLTGNVDVAVRMQSLFRPSGRDRRPTDLEQVTFDAGGTELSAYDFGEGSPVMLLHGLGASKLSWLPLLPSLAERHRVIVPDLPGFGESEKPRLSYTPAYFAGVVDRLIASSGAGRVTLVGNSLGGRIALETAVRYPDRVAGVVLLGAAVPGGRWQIVLQFATMLPSEVAAIPLPLRRRLVRAGIRQLFADPSRLPDNAYIAGADEFLRVYRSVRARMASFSTLQSLIADEGPAFWTAARQIEVPALVLHGSDDRLVPAALGARLAEAMPSSELAMLSGIGHVPQFEAPARTRSLVGAFLERAVA